jgi:hypothetical protein
MRKIIFAVLLLLISCPGFSQNFDIEDGELLEDSKERVVYEDSHFRTKSFTCVRGDEVVFSSCITTIALRHWDSEICDHIVDGKLKGRCVYRVALISSDVEVCKRIEDEEEIQKCVLRVAVKSSNAKGCHLIEDEKEIQRCVFKIATRTLEPKACGEIGDKEGRKSCVTRVAAKSKKIGYCFHAGSLSGSVGCIGYFLNREYQKIEGGVIVVVFLLLILFISVCIDFFLLSRIFSSTKKVSLSWGRVSLVFVGILIFLVWYFFNFLFGF